MAETLIVELDARTEALERALRRVNDQLEDTEESTNNADSSLMKMSKTAGAVGRGLKTVAGVAVKSAAAVMALKAAVVATTSVAAAYGREIELNAELSKLSVESMQAWAHATGTVGIDLEKLGDITKDTSEKIGDFINTGGGGFQDFADAMKLTKEEASKAAQEFQGMAGTDILQSMVTQMEAAGVSSEQMSHALEGMASDTTRLIPLLRDGGAAVKEMKQQFYETNVVLSETDIEKLGELSSSFQDLSSTFSATMGKFSVEYADQINSIIENTKEGLKIVGDEFASGSLTDRLNSFYSAFTDSWASAFGDNILVMDEFADDAEQLISSIAGEFLDFAFHAYKLRNRREQSKRDICRYMG